MPLRHILLTALLLASASAFAFDHTHSAFTKLLQTYVDDEGMVDYEALKTNGQPRLNAYLDQLGGVSRTAFEKWSRDQKVAYYINAYNAYTLKAIVDHYPIKAGGWISGLRFPSNSIRQIDGVWDELTWKAGGRKLTLDQIEHKHLREVLDEPRVHFAVNCASIGCPELRRKAFTAQTLDQQLNDAAKAFITNPDKVRTEGSTLYVNPILKWYEEDFDRYKAAEGYGTYNGVVAYISKYRPRHERAALLNGRYDLEWLDYDWSLNDQS